MPYNELFTSPFTSYLPQIEDAIRKSVSTLGKKTPLRDACEYALCNGGKRVRPALVLMIAKALDPNKDVMNAALAVEYFHTASLIADDLPCMDDDDMRRNQPSLHKAFNESIALLATYALISSGYEKVPLNNVDEKTLYLALKSTTQNTGIFGVTGGQYLDLFPPSLSQEILNETLQKKTGALFELSFVLGWLFGGGDHEKLPHVRKAAHHFGTAFQVWDDINDYSEDLTNSRKINAATILGTEAAEKLFQKEVEGFFKSMESLSLEIPELKLLFNQSFGFSQL